MNPVEKLLNTLAPRNTRMGGTFLDSDLLGSGDPAGSDTLGAVGEAAADEDRLAPHRPPTSPGRLCGGRLQARHRQLRRALGRR